MREVGQANGKSIIGGRGDLCGSTVCHLTEEDYTFAIGEFFSYRRSRLLLRDVSFGIVKRVLIQTYHVTLVLESNISDGHLVCDGDFFLGSLVVLYQSTSIEALQTYTYRQFGRDRLDPFLYQRLTLERPDVQYTIDVTGKNTESFRVMMFNVVRLLFPPNGPVGVVWVGDDLGRFPKVDHFVFKHVVTDTYDHSFVEVWPSRECPLANHLFSNLVGRSALAFCGGDGDDHTLVSRIGLENVDAVVPQCTVVWEGMQRWETGQSLVS